MSDFFSQQLGELQARIILLEKRFNTLETQETAGNFTAGSLLFGSVTGSITEDNNSLYWNDTNNWLGIGTNAPTARLTLKGTDSTYAGGPHMETYTTADSFPQLQILPYTHDNVNISFDAYWDGSAWKSSDAGSNFQFRKSADVLGIWGDTGITAGNTLTWDQLFSIPTAGGFTSQIYTATTNSAVGHSAFTLNTTGTAANGLGPAIFFNVEDDGGTVRNAADIRGVWATAASATRKGRMGLVVYDAAGGREVIRIETNGSAGMIGFLGTTASAKLTVTGSRGGNAALASLLTQLATYGLITDSSSA